MKGKQDKFIKLYEQHNEAFGRFCRARAYGIMDVNDLMSETLLKAYESFEKLKDETAFLGYLIGISKNVLNTKLRRKKFKGGYTEKLADQIPSEGISADTRLDIQFLYQCLNDLPEIQKEAVILFEISGYSIKEIAVIQNAGESAVKQRLKRGREKLGELMKNDELRSEPISGKSQILVSIFL
jgi:RNA polymerase sigma-70 factor (ECF subfamily)